MTVDRDDLRWDPTKQREEWTTGDEPMTGPQESYLATLAQETGRDVPEELTKAEASRLIDELREQAPRVDAAPGSDA